MFFNYLMMNRKKSKYHICLLFLKKHESIDIKL